MKIANILAKIINKVAQTSVEEINDGVTSSEETRRLCRRAAAESCVLLKNDNVLPIASGSTVAAFGRGQTDYFYVGYGSGGDVKAPYKVSPAEGLQNVGINLEPQLAAEYKRWIAKNPAYDGFWGHWPYNHDEMPLAESLVSDSSKVTDTAVVFIGRSAGEDRENVLKRGSWYLTRREECMLDVVTKHFKKVCVVVNSGSLMDFSWISKYNVGAVLLAWQGGQESGNGVADVICGNVNPCGKLSDTVSDIVGYLSVSAPSSHKKTIYSDDIYVGYRATETFDVLGQKVVFPFGYGCSYTTFDIAVRDVEVNEDVVSVTTDVTNTGNVDGKQVVQLYLAAPQGKLGKPSRVLVGYYKTKLLSAGESEKHVTTFRLSDFASYDDSGVSGFKNSFVLEEGAYSLFVGSDVRSAKECFVWHGPLVVLGTTSTACAPQQSFLRVKNQNGNIVYENTEVQQNDLRSRILQNLPSAATAKHTDISFEEVKSGSKSIGEFVAELSFDELETLSRGSLDGMYSPLGAAGNAGVFGGTSDVLRKKGVPSICTNDGPSGVRLRAHSSLFPIGTALACTFDDELVEQVGKALGREVVARGSDVLLAPGMNIHRSPLCGRNFEYFSEDPLLTGNMATAYVKGVQAAGASAVPKHFACNNTERNRLHNDSVVSLRALREIYLKPFEKCVKNAHPHYIMASYNKLNGVYNCYNYDLCTTILRNEWGFDGCVMTDWWIVYDKSSLFKDLGGQAYRVRAGVDIFMPGCAHFGRYVGKVDGTLKKSYDKGGITLGELQQTAKRVLLACLRKESRSELSNDNAEEKMSLN